MVCSERRHDGSGPPGFRPALLNVRWRSERNILVDILSEMDFQAGLNEAIEAELLVWTIESGSVDSLPDCGRPGFNIYNRGKFAGILLVIFDIFPCIETPRSGD